MRIEKATVKRRTSRIKGLCYIPGGEQDYNFQVPETMEDLKVLFQDDGENVPEAERLTAEQKVLAACARASQRSARLAITGSDDSPSNVDSVFSNIRSMANSMFVVMQKSNPKVTEAEVASFLKSNPAVVEQLNQIGVTWGDPSDAESSENEAGESEKD